MKAVIKIAINQVLGSQPGKLTAAVSIPDLADQVIGVLAGKYQKWQGFHPKYRNHKYGAYAHLYKSIHNRKTRDLEQMNIRLEAEAGLRSGFDLEDPAGEREDENPQDLTLNQVDVTSSDDDQSDNQQDEAEITEQGGNLTTPTMTKTGFSLQDNSSICGTVETSYPSDTGNPTMSPRFKLSVASLTTDVIGCLCSKKRLIKELEKNNQTFAKLIMNLKETSANLDNEYLSKAMDARF